MRKNSTMFMICVWLILMLYIYALLAPGMFITDRMVLLLACAAVGCVYMVCESRVANARQMMMTLETVVSEKTKPPEGVNDIT